MSNEKNELIKRGPILQNMDVWMEVVHDREALQMLKDCRNLVSAAPAARGDIIPKAQWLENGLLESETKPWFYQCSNCGTIGIPLFNYCPNCGAYMKEVPTTEDNS